MLGNERVYHTNMDTYQTICKYLSLRKELRIMQNINSNFETYINFIKERNKSHSSRDIGIEIRY
jgi:hypothetical protein